MEIEKKFTVKYLPEGYDKGTSYKIEQGYICKNPTVRIRKRNDDYILTIKSRKGIDCSSDLSVCHEHEYDLTEEAYNKLKEKVDYNIIQKTRYIIDLEDGLIAELDVFEGKLQGLIVVEVEFDSEEEARAFKAPDWFGEDVSASYKYRNSYLSTVESL